MYSGKEFLPKDETDDSFRREIGILVTCHPSALVEDRLGEIILPLQLGLTFLTDLDVYFSPHVGDDDDVLERALSSQTFRKSQSSSRYPGHLEVGDPVEIKDPGKLLAPPRICKQTM
jgi:hypothetical protein